MKDRTELTPAEARHVKRLAIYHARVAWSNTPIECRGPLGQWSPVRTLADKMCDVNTDGKVHAFYAM